MSGQPFIPMDYEVFAGLDVDKRSISVTFTTHQGFLKSLRLPYSVEHLLNHVRKHFPDQQVAFAYEAGPTGYGLYDGLGAQEYRCLIASPSMIPKAPGQRVKTNRLDSRGLAETLRGFWSVRVSGNWRVIFRFKNGDAFDIDYSDYHISRGDVAYANSASNALAACKSFVSSPSVNQL